MQSAERDTSNGPVVVPTQPPLHSFEAGAAWRTFPSSTFPYMHWRTFCAWLACGQKVLWKFHRRLMRSKRSKFQVAPQNKIKQNFPEPKRSSRSLLYCSIHSATNGGRFIHPFIHSSIHSFIHSSIHSFIHSFQEQQDGKDTIKLELIKKYICRQETTGKEQAKRLGKYDKIVSNLTKQYLSFATCMYHSALTAPIYIYIYIRVEIFNPSMYIYNMHHSSCPPMYRMS
jgi:hypothetical protein